MKFTYLLYTITTLSIVRLVPFYDHILVQYAKENCNFTLEYSIVNHFYFQKGPSR